MTSTRGMPHARRRRARRGALTMAAAVAGMGSLHLLVPRAFDMLIPRVLPGSARAWTYGSGIAALTVAVLLTHPAS